MKKIIFTILSCVILTLSSCSQPKTVSKNTEASALTEKAPEAIPASKALTNQELARELYEATHNVKLSGQEMTSVFSSSPENLLAWQKVLENYSGNSSVDLSYIQKLISGMKGKL